MAQHPQAKILLVEDDRTNASLGEATLKQYGHDVTIIHEGNLCVETLLQDTYDVVLLDIVLPDCSGYYLLQTIRQDEKLQHIPVIAMTGLDDYESITQAYEVGATDCIIKPFDWIVLAHRVQYIAKNSHDKRALEFALYALRRSYNRLFEAQSSMRVGQWEWVVDSPIMSWSEQVYDLLSLDKDTEPTLNNLLSAIPRNQRDAIEENINALKRGEKNNEVEIPIVIPEENGRYLQQRIELITDNHARSILIGTIQDITERVRTDEKIRKLAYYDRLCPYTAVN